MLCPTKRPKKKLKCLNVNKDRWKTVPTKIKKKFRNEFSGFLSEHNPDFRLFNH